MRDWQDYRAGSIAPPEIWVVGDGSCVDAALAVAASGARVAHRLTSAEGLAAFESGLADGLVLLELSAVLSADEDALVDRIATSAVVAIVSFTLAVVDRMVALLSGPFVTMLCEPDLTDRIAAISLACLPVGNRVAETDGQTEAMRLHKLSSEVARIAQVLASLVEDAAPGQSPSVSDGLTGYRPPPDGSGASVVTAKDIRTMIRLRRQRDSVFGDGLFSDPVWDIMLDLAASRLEGTQVAVSSLCIAAAVPPTTALRWIAMLTAAGTIVRVPDADDRRRVFLELSDVAAATVLDFLGKAKRAGAALI